MSKKYWFTPEEFAQEKNIDNHYKREAVRTKASKYLTTLEETKHFLSILQESCDHQEVINGVCIDCFKELNG